MRPRLFGFGALAVALFACPVTPSNAQRPRPTAEEPRAPAPVTDERDPEACLTARLKEAGLNAYGDPPDTMYAGGSPLFDESTGVTIPRREYVKARRPDLVARCPAP